MGIGGAECRHLAAKPKTPARYEYFRLSPFSDKFVNVTDLVNVALIPSRQSVADRTSFVFYGGASLVLPPLLSGAINFRV